MNIFKIVRNLFIIVLLISCSKVENSKTIVVKNKLNIHRSFETIELTKEILKVEELIGLGIREVSTGVLQVTQLVDENGDGSMDKLLFQPKVEASSESVFEIITIIDKKNPKTELLCYSRFVPERTDDYAWENDKVAFRVYGPTAQKMKEEGIPGGTLSSGVDAWLKRVDYPIINKWYKKHTDETGSYHEDTGEGLDNFHVGISRGVGGIAVKNSEKLYYSKNYTKWRTITNGPIRTSFYLEYENWDAGGNLIIESKIISLDLGSNLSKFETYIKGANIILAGLTLHEKDGEISTNSKSWVSYWQPHKDSEIGTAIVATNDTFKGFEKYDVEEKDLSNAYAYLNVVNSKVTYYAGFAWKKSNQYTTKKSWESYLNSFSDKINFPLQVTLN